MNEMKELNTLTEKIIGLAIEEHCHLSPGLLDSTYRKCLCYELGKYGLEFKEAEPVPIKYKKLLIDCAYRADIIVKNRVIIEVKAIETVLPVHEAQILTHLKFTGIIISLILSFNVPLLKDGIIRKIY